MPKKTQRFITLSNATLRRYEELTFCGTDWEIRTGQQWAVVGPNGSGKTTLARALSGEVPVVRGELVYHCPETDSPEDAVAHVSFDDQQDVALHESAYYQARWHSEEEDGLSVDSFLSEERVFNINPFEVIEQPRSPARFRRARAKAIRLMDIGHLLDRNVVHLSNGETRKVLIAQALMREPRLLVLDDPFAGLDAASRRHLRRLVGALTRTSMQLVLLTPRADDVPSSITHVLRVENNRVVAQGKRAVMLKEGAGSATPSTTSRPATVKKMKPQVEPSRRGPPLVRMKNVSVKYDEVTVLRNVNWTVFEGEHWAVLGPNGAGKTTLLSLILADNPHVYANDIQLFGRQRGTGESIWEIKRRIGWMSSELHLHYPGDRACLDAVCSGFFDSMGLFETCSAKQRREARSWLRRMDLAGCEDKELNGLSYGEQRRVLLARAMVKDPDLLILDEPCQGLDAGHRDLVLGAIDRAVEESGAHVVFVTHRSDEMPACISHVLKLRNGRVTRKGLQRAILP